MTGGEIPRRVQTSPDDWNVGDFAGGGTLDRIATSRLRIPNTAHHLSELLGLERGAMVGTVHGAIDGEVLLEQLGAHGRGGNRYRDSIGVVAPADRQLEHRSH